MTTSALTRAESKELQEQNQSLKDRILSYGRRAMAKKEVGVDMGSQLAGAAVGGAAAGVADHYDAEGVAIGGTAVSLAVGAALRLKNPSDVAGKVMFSTACGSIAYMTGKEVKAYLDEDAPA